MKQPSKRLQAIMDKEERTESMAERQREMRSPTLEMAETKPKSTKTAGRGLKGTDKLNNLQAKNRKKVIPQFKKSVKLKKK